ncbi:MAG TPA: phosphoribosylamine--glycine ligase [Oligoflexia bacterium]|nr:phosphoribosylamine--glycine ligase [Oligoflexia bacterium]HMP47162.1 phosphoribosylamine--glycine ligase [Oligoflexia bacterium]
MKKVLVIGSGAREHALSWKISQSSRVSKVYGAPGNAAIFEKYENVQISSTDIEKLANFALEEEIYLTVVGPEAPLALGVVDLFKSRNLPIFGPSKAAAKLESSKIFSKMVMEEASVPTARAKSFSDAKLAFEYIKKVGVPVVIKADGLAAGKGVYVCHAIEEALNAVSECLESNRFGSSGSEILIEEFLPGKEASVMAIISGNNISMLPVSSDYKRIFDADKGPNTGGMGSVSPSSVFPESRLAEISDNLFLPIIKCLRDNHGIEYSGFLYAGLMVMPSGDYRVLEFNCRLGDPETQSLMLRVEEDFFELMEKAVFAPDTLPPCVKLGNGTALTVVLASGGYPGTVHDGYIISGLDLVHDGVTVFHAGTERKGLDIFSKGGRVLSVTGIGDSLSDVREAVYDSIKNINFSGMQFRKDIGH